MENNGHKKLPFRFFFVTLRSGFGIIRASKALQWCSLIPCSQSTTSINLSEYRYRYLISIFVLLSILLCLAELKQKLLKLLNMSSSSISRFYYVEIIFISIGQIMFELFYRRGLFYCEWPRRFLLPLPIMATILNKISWMDSRNDALLNPEERRFFRFFKRKIMYV